MAQCNNLPELSGLCQILYSFVSFATSLHRLQSVYTSPRICILLILQFRFTQSGNAQPHSRFDFFLGYGFYEGCTAGSSCISKSGKQSVSASFGYDKFLRPDEETRSISLAWNVSIFRKQVNSTGAFKWYLQNKLIYWQLEDPYYKWKVLSVNPAVSRQFHIYKKMQASVDAGPSINFVLYNHRKTDREVGWPYHVLPNVRLLLRI